MKTHDIVRFAIVLLLAGLAADAAATLSAQYPSYELEAVFDPARATIVGRATIDLQPGEERTIELGSLRVLSISNGSLSAAEDSESHEPSILHAEGTVEIRYEGVFRSVEGDVIGKDNISLAGIWYPAVAGTFCYHLTANLPRDFTAVSEADSVRRTENGDRATVSFNLPYPQRDQDGITFVASTQWVSRSLRYGNVDLSFHVYPRNAGRLNEMIGDAVRYLRQLEEKLGPYPFKSLVVLENPLPITYSLSRYTYVLLSRGSVAAVGSAAPEDNSLNHEIAHEWFGNAVLVDDTNGNWCEGLASYFSDHLENERLDRGWERRQRTMGAYRNNVTEEATSPLSSFSESSDRSSQVIGYAKSANVFHMLRRKVGDEVFFEAMRGFVTDYAFSEASWTDIEQTFERAAKVDLGPFFDQWLGRTSIPELGLDEVTTRPLRHQHELRFTITQKAPTFSLTLPLTLYFRGGRSESLAVPTSAERQEFRYILEEAPIRVVLDENYDVFRRLTPAENPPTLNALLALPRVTVVASPNEWKKFSKLIEAFTKKGVAIVWYDWTREGQGKTRTSAKVALNTTQPGLLLLGRDNPYISVLFGRLNLPPGGFTLTVLKHPQNQENLVAILTAASKAEMDAALDEFIHRPRYGSAVFEKGKLITRELREGQRGISKDVAHAAS